jgi:hypothetical protein
MILEPTNVAGPDLLGQAVDDLDAGEVALVDRAVEGLPREGFLMDRAVRVAVEKAAEIVLKFADPDLRLVTSSQARSWRLSHLPPSIVSMKWRSAESPGASATL